MKTVDTDNFGGDHPDEKFLLWSMPEVDAQAICDVLNRRGGEHTRRWYRGVPDDYQLQPRFEP